MKTLRSIGIMCWCFALFGLLGTIYHIVKPDTAFEKYIKTAEKGYIYTQRLDIEKEVYRIGGVETVLSADETGRRTHMWNKYVSHISKHWVDGFGGFKGFNSFKPKMDEFIAAGIPVNTTRLLSHSYQLGKMNVSNGPLNDLRFCEKQGWKDINMLMIVAKHGCYDCVVHMVETLKADVNHVSCDGRTAAMYAGERSHFAVVDYLVDRMSDEVKNVQMFHRPKGRSLYDLLGRMDYEDKIDVPTSTERFRYGLWASGIFSAIELNNEILCFPDANKDSTGAMKVFVHPKKYYAQYKGTNATSDISSCMFLLKQYEYRCKKHAFECYKQKQMFEYIEERGYELYNWKNDRTYFNNLVPDSNPTSAIDIVGGEFFRMEMEKLNDKKCNSLFSDCRKKLKWKR